MTIAHNTALAQFKDIIYSKNYYYSRSAAGSEPFNKECHEKDNTCADLRPCGSLKFSQMPHDGAPSAVIVHIERQDSVRGNPEIAIVFQNSDTVIGLMCEVRAGTYDKVAQAISRNPALLEKLFSAFDCELASNVSIPPKTAIDRKSATITFNRHRQELELNRYADAK